MNIRAIRGSLLFLLLGTAAFAGDLSIVRIFTGWRDAASFKRISEYFDGQENSSGQVVLRSQPTARDGYYFLTRLANAGAPVPVRLRLTVILPATDKPREFTFTSAAATGDTVYNLGLTGADWPDAKSSPVAWKLDVLAADGGAVLATETSYLWDKPAAK